MKYLGIKIIEAETMSADDAALVLGRMPSVINAKKVGEEYPGYLVRYPDDYTSWSPAEQFEKAYFPLENKEGTTITQRDVELMRGKLGATQLGEKTALVSAQDTLIGFDTFATSSCVNPDNFSLETGMECGTKEINNKFWEHLGFVLQWALTGLEW